MGYGFYIHKNRNYTNNGDHYGYISHLFVEAENACIDKLLKIIKNE